MMRRKRTALFFSMLLTAAVCGENVTMAAETEAAEITAETASDHATENAVTLTEGKYSEEKLDASWDLESSVEVLLEGQTITAESEAVKVDGSTATITEEGTYVLSGNLEDGQIIVDVEDNSDGKAQIKLVLNGVSINCSTSAPIYIKSGDTVIVPADGTENKVSDGEQYVLEDGEDEPKAAVFAKDDLTLNGSGTLTVVGNYNKGIQCKDALKFVDGTYVITAVDDAVVGKDSVSIKNGTFTIEAGGDGVKATNTEETDKGYIIIEGGTFDITAAEDGMQAETLLRINDGTFSIVTGGGSQNAEQKTGGMDFGGGMKTGSEEETSGKALKSYVDLVIAGGTFSIDSCDDALHSNQNVTVEGGEFAIQVGDDGVHADNLLTVNDGTLDIQKSYEGLEGFHVLINGGTVNIVSSDDGINAAGDSGDASNMGGGFFPDMGNGKEGNFPKMGDGAGRDFSDMENGAGDGTPPDMENGAEDGMRPDVENGAGDGTPSEMEKEAGDGTPPDMENGAGDGIPSEMGKEAGDGTPPDMENGAGNGTPPDMENGIGEDGIAKAITEKNPRDGAGAKDGGRGWMGGGARGGGMPGEDQGAILEITGGNVYVNAEGDGLDANGEISVSGGNIIVHGPSNGGNGALDYATECKITGGNFLALGSAGMAQNPSENSTQPVIVHTLSQSVQAGTTISVKDSQGTVLAQVVTEKNVQWYAVSLPKLTLGETYILTVGDAETKVTPENTITQIRS